jgi:hypothetical protein
VNAADYGSSQQASGKSSRSLVGRHGETMLAAVIRALCFTKGPLSYPDMCDWSEQDVGTESTETNFKPHVSSSNVSASFDTRTPVSCNNENGAVDTNFVLTSNLELDRLGHHPGSADSSSILACDTRSSRQQRQLDAEDQDLLHPMDIERLVQYVRGD